VLIGMNLLLIYMVSDQKERQDCGGLYLAWFNLFPTSMSIDVEIILIRHRNSGKSLSGVA